MELIRGTEVVAALNEQIAMQVEKLREGHQRLPKLAIIRVGERPDDISYERGAGKRMDKVGILHEEYCYPEEVEKDFFYKQFDQINENPEIDGILLLRPLPKHLEEKELERRMNPAKDVDGISSFNQAKVMAGMAGGSGRDDFSGFAPCTPEAVIEMLDFAGIDLTGKRVVIVGRSMVVGKPLAMLMLSRNATVTICHTRTQDLPGTCQRAEILVAAAGKAKMLDDRYVGEGAVVVDVGINMDKEGNLCGDVDRESLTAGGKAAFLTPVPGGVGTVTTSVLAKHVLQARLMRECDGRAC